jgi:F-type H+-transporting ATPase subunit delta
MQNESLARRYATAVYMLAKDQNQVGRVGDDLDTIAQALAGNESVRGFYVAPTIERDVKERAFVEALGTRVSDIALHTLLLLIRKRREALLDEIVREYRKLEMAGRGAEPLIISTARPLDESAVRTLVERLEQTYGKKFEATVRQDRQLIGGVRIAMGDRVIDGSVAGRLEELTRTLFAAGA